MSAKTEALLHGDSFNSLIAELESLCGGHVTASLPLPEIRRTLSALLGLSSVTEQQNLQSLLFGLLRVLDGLASGRQALSEQHLLLFRIAGPYCREAATNQLFKTQRFNDALERIASGIQVDLEEMFLRDIVTSRLVTPSPPSSAELIASPTVPIPLHSIDHLSTAVNALILEQYQLKHRIEQIRSLDTVFIDLANSSVNASRLSAARRQCADIERDILGQALKFEQAVIALQERALALRQLPIDLLFTELRTRLALVAIRLSRPCRLEFPTIDMALDKLVIQTILDPLSELLSNAAEHCLNEKGGEIVCSVNREGEQIVISVLCRGRGFDFSHLRERCQEIFPQDRDRINALPETGLLRYCLMPGVAGTEGRGFGLPRALEAMRKIRGSLILESTEPGLSKASISFPRSLTTLSGYFILSGKNRFFLPSAWLREVLIVPRERILDLVTRPALELRGEVIPVYPLSTILGGAEAELSERLSVLIASDGGQSVGIIVSEIISHASAIFKPLPRNLEHCSCLQGVVLDEAFHLVTILYLPQVIERLRQVPGIELREKYSARKPSFRRILVVDDSPITREILVGLLRKSGYEVDEAQDGVEALLRTQQTIYDLIISDTMMPRMDGLTFLENLRREKGGANTPVILLTSLSEKETLEILREWGPASTFSKDDFQREALLDQVKDMMAQGLELNR